MVNPLILGIAVLFYFLITLYCGWLGYRHTKTSDDFMVAGRKVNPFVLALSYGAAFISTSAIVGFGGYAGAYGMGILWLVFMNIFVGIFIAFVVFGSRTRKIGANLKAVTFPELLGRRYESRFIQGFSAFLIVIFMPLYTGGVLIGGARFMETILGLDYNTSVLILIIITAVYVIAGGLLAVMYTDAMQGALMFIGMSLLYIFTYIKLGGVVSAHQALTNLTNFVPLSLQMQGHNGWTAMPDFGSPIWWNLVSTIILGVGIGVLAQPQLVVRFMTVKNTTSLKRAVLSGGPFIFMMVGVAYTVGALSNVYFMKTQGNIALDVAGGNIDKIIPEYINSAMPEYFVIFFMLTLLAAAMSTLSSQFHNMGTAIGHDLYKEYFKKGQVSHSVTVTRLGIAITILMSVVFAYILPGGVIARATSLFFSLCAAAFLPMYIGAIFWKRMNRKGAIASLIIGSISSIFWLTFVHAKEATAFGICQLLFNKPTLLTGTWTLVDPILIATPISMLAAIVISLLTKPPEREHIEKCFGKE